MALPPLLFETIVSPIEQAGDYFIMDTEQLISRPYDDMRRESMDDGLRRTSMSEKLTNVRNKVTNNSLNNTKDRLEKQENSSLRDMHESNSRLRYHVKLLDLDRRKHTIEINKRLQPTKDYSYDDQQLETSEKRLGVMGPCYYLQKDMRYPVRHSGLQETVTPALAKARKTLHRYKFELLSPTPGLSVCGTLSRASSKRNASARLETPESHPASGFRRKSWSAHGSPSASSSARSATKWRFFTQPTESTDGSLHDAGHDPTLGKSLPHISQSTGSLNIRSNSQHRGQSGHKVKFAFPKKDKSFAKLDAHILARSKTFHHGERVQPSRSCYTEDSDDEDPPPRKVDLQALFSGKTPTQSRPSTQASSLGKRKKSTYNAPGHLTQEMLERESAMIQRKINTFLNKVETWDPTVRFDTDSSSDDDFSPAPMIPKAHVTPFSRHFLSQMAEETRQEEDKEKEARALELKNKEKEEQRDEKGEDNSNDEDNVNDEDKKEEEKDKSSAIQKWKDLAWRVTRPNITKEKNLSTEDLILQRIMGLEISTGPNKKHGIPLHSASRALRHTPTFKMQKVVEDLMLGRTKFQQFEVDNLRKQLESGVDISELEQKPQAPPEPPKWKPGGTSFLPDHLSELSEEEEEPEQEEEPDKEEEAQEEGFNLRTI